MAAQNWHQSVLGSDRLRFQMADQKTWPKKDQAAQGRLEAVIPKHKFLPDLRSAAHWHRELLSARGRGKDRATSGRASGFTQNGIQLKNGCDIACDLVVLSLGSEISSFPFLPEKYRQILESESDGPQLYRHLIHPRIPGIGFAGFNHGFMHIPSVELGTLWLCATCERDQAPGSRRDGTQHRTYRKWKRANIQFEPSRGVAV